MSTSVCLHHNTEVRMKVVHRMPYLNYPTKDFPQRIPQGNQFKGVLLGNLPDLREVVKNSDFAQGPKKLGQHHFLRTVYKVQKPIVIKNVGALLLRTGGHDIPSSGHNPRDAISPRHAMSGQLTPHVLKRIVSGIYIQAAYVLLGVAETPPKPNQKTPRRRKAGSWQSS